MFKKDAVVVKTPTALDLEITRILNGLGNWKIESEEYKTMVARLSELTKLQECEKEIIAQKWSVSPDTIVTVVGSLLGIMIIVWHEKADVITTKALGFVLKGRV